MSEFNRLGLALMIFSVWIVAIIPYRDPHVSIEFALIASLGCFVVGFVLFGIQKAGN